MDVTTLLLTAHIHLEWAILRVHVQDADLYPIDEMNNDPEKPEAVLNISRLNGREQTKTTLLINVMDEYDVVELADWIAKFSSECTSE